MSSFFRFLLFFLGNCVFGANFEVFPPQLEVKTFDFKFCHSSNYFIHWSLNLLNRSKNLTSSVQIQKHTPLEKALGGHLACSYFPVSKVKNFDLKDLNVTKILTLPLNSGRLFYLANRTSVSKTIARFSAV